MGTAKIQLSAEELQLAQNSDFILTKNRVITKATTLLEALSANVCEAASPLLQLVPADSRSPKISRGEKYNELPYVLLDYPRHFKQTEILAVRTMFWWGHHISMTLHLKGHFQERYTPVFIEATEWQNNWLLQTQGDEWLHHTTHATHRPLSQINRQQREALCSSLPFIKIGYFLRVDQWNEALNLLTDAFGSLVAALGSVDQFPRR